MVRAVLIVLCLIVFSMVILLVPTERGIRVDGPKGLEATVHNRLHTSMLKIRRCHTFNRRPSGLLAAAIVIVEEDARRLLEVKTEAALQHWLPSLVRMMNISIGPAQLKPDRITAAPSIDPMTWCGAMQIVQADILRSISAFEPRSRIRYLTQYNGAVPGSPQATLYIAYVELARRALGNMAIK